MGMCQSRAITIQWFGGSDSELGVFIFPFFIPYSMGSEELRIEFPNQQID